MTAPRVDILNVNFFDWRGDRFYNGGAERYVLELAALARSIGLAPRLLQNAEEPFTRSVEGVEVLGVPAAGTIDFAGLSRGLAPHVEGAALVIVSQLELACALPAGVPAIGISHGIWWDDPERRHVDPDPGRIRLLEALMRVDACVCVDTNFVNWARATGAPHRGPLVYLPNFVALDRYRPGDKDFGGRLNALFPRRLVRERGFHATLDAFDELLARHDDLELTLCGGGAPAEEAMARAFAARHAQRVRWTDEPLEAMPDVYASSHIVLVPTEFAEGTSLSCLEAMAARNAVIATHVGGLTNLVVDGYNGLLIAPGARPIVEAVERLLADRALAARLAAHALGVASTFGLARWQARWLSLLQQALGRRDLVAPGCALPPAAAPADADARPLEAAFADAVAARDRLQDSLRLAVAERDAARRRQERALVESGAARAEAETAQRERDIAQREGALARDLLAQLQRERDQLAADVARHRDEATAAESAHRAAEDRVATLTDVVAARDAGIAWLHGELALAYDRLARRRRSFKLLGVDLAHALTTRVPGLKRVLKAILPFSVRHRLNQAAAIGLSAPSAALAAMPTGASPHAATPSATPAAIPVPAHPGAPADVTRPAGFDVVCLANIEWTARHQRPQHMMSHFAADGHRVFYVIASRTPPPGETYAVEAVAPNVFQVTLAVPRAQDFYGETMTEASEHAMAEALAALARDQRIKTAVGVVHLPYWTRLALRLRRDRGWRILYDCMDEWTDFPAIGRDVLVDEERLVREADVVTVTAALLEEKWRGHAKRCVLVRNGVDFAFFARHCAPNELLAEARRPIVGYYGALADWVDLELVAAVARARPEWTFVLIGDVFVEDLAGLDALPNVRLLGRRPYEDMPRYLYHFDVCMVPFKLNDVTHAVDPVKFYEYVSAGKPVVAVPLKEMAVYGEHAYFATGAEAFEQAIARALAEGDPALWARRVALARANDWAERYRATLEAIEAAHPLVSIVVVSYFNAPLTRLCLESILARQTWPRIEVIVVDNASTDETRAYLRYLARVRPEVRVILNGENRGFAAANNQGLAIARGDYLVLLNNDTVVPRGWLEPLLARLDDPAVGLVGPVTNFAGNEARIDVDYSSLDQMEAFAERYVREHAGRTFDIPVLAMFCVAMRRDTFARIGPLDERFGVGMFEDDDYCRRAHAAGLRTLCVEDAFVHHFGQAAFKKLIETGEYGRLWAANQRYFESKWGDWTPHRHRSP